MSQLEIRALVGSLRRHSMNRGLFQYALEHTPEGVHLEEVPISNLPLFSEDLEANPPESVIQLWMALRAADAFWFITPEYNYSIPGALKNAIDWGSRAPNRDTFYGKVGAIMGASGGGSAPYGPNYIYDTP